MSSSQNQNMCNSVFKEFALPQVNGSTFELRGGIVLG